MRLVGQEIRNEQADMGIAGQQEKKSRCGVCCATDRRCIEINWGRWATDL